MAYHKKHEVTDLVANRPKFFVTPSTERWDLLPHGLEPELALWLLWPIQYNGRDAEPVLGLAFMRTSSFYASQGSPSIYTGRPRRETEAPGQKPQPNSQPTARIRFVHLVTEPSWKQLPVPGDTSCPYSEPCPNCQIVIKYMIVTLLSH